jgi:hypothetical protein
MPYEAQPGTFPYRVIAHLKSLPEGTEVSVTELAVALGWDNARGLKSWLVPAVEGGALAIRIGGARMCFYRLGDGKDQYAKEDDKTVAHVPASAVSSIFAFADQRQAAPFSTMESSDGRLVLQRHGRVIAELTPDEASEHRKFLKAEADAKLRKEMRKMARELREAAQHLLFAERETME